jgi:hypothetical protein
VIVLEALINCAVPIERHIGRNRRSELAGSHRALFVTTWILKQDGCANAGPSSDIFEMCSLKSQQSLIHFSPSEMGVHVGFRSPSASLDAAGFTP